MKTRRLLRPLRRFLRADSGVSTLEYAMLIGLMAVAIGAAITTFSNDVQTAILAIGDRVDDLNVGALNNPNPDTTAN